MFKTTFQGESKNQRLVASRGGDARKTCILGAPGKDIETEVVNYLIVELKRDNLK